MTKGRYPTSEELYAYEREARRMRAQALAEAFAAGFAAVKSAYARVMTTLSTKVVRHA